MSNGADELLVALKQVQSRVQLAIDAVSNGSDNEQDAARSAKVIMTQAQSDLGDAFAKLRAHFRVIFTLQPGQTDHGNAAVMGKK